MIEMYEPETEAVFDKIGRYIATFFKCVGVFAFVCFCLGYWSVTK